MSKYKILSLDGGGSWAMIQIKALQVLYGADAKGHEVLKDFDLVIANSGGSIAMAAMLKNLPLSYILTNYYLKSAVLKTIFVELPFFNLGKLLNKFGAGPKYSAAKKLPGFQKLLDDVSMGNGALALGNTPIVELPKLFGGKTNFVIMAFDYDSRKEVFFRSNVASKAQSSGSVGVFSSVTLAEAIHASSNAPIQFFDAPAMFTINGVMRNFWDGAMGGYNNPVAAGVIEALSVGVKTSDICVLSIGTGNTMLPVKNTTTRSAVSNDLYREIKKPGLLNDIAEEGTCIVDDPPDAASFIAYCLLGNIPAANDAGSNIVRLNPLVQPVIDNAGLWNYPTYNAPDGSPKINPKEFVKLVNMDLAAIEQDQVELINKLGDAWIKDEVNNQGIRHNPDTTIDIGYGKFTEAIAAWKRCNQ
jgi:hypothetical protein